MTRPKHDRTRQLDGYIRQAGMKIFEARACREQSRHAAAVHDCQEAIELFAKCVFLVRGRPYPREHLLLEADFHTVITGLPPDAAYLNLPRLYLLHRFWSEFYSQAKYGLETLAIPAEELFQSGESDLAIAHASEWQQAITRLRIMLGETA
jgi:HEPN domain-containing protein